MDEEDDLYGTESSVDSQSDYLDGSTSGDSSSEDESDAEDIEVPQGVQAEIDTDFNRLVSNIRMTDDVSSSAMLHREWDFNIAQQDADFRDDLREASGIGKKKGKKRGRHRGPTLSHEVRALIGEGNQAYVDGNIPEAIRIMQEVIRIEPRASSAWFVIAQCYEDSNESQKALQLRIMAAHLRHDADEWEGLAIQSRELGYSQQALYCYSKVYSLDPTNVNALWDRASMAKEMNDLRIARHSLLAILKLFPHDMSVLAELRPILIELSELPLCASLYQAALEHHQTIQPLGHAQPVDPSISDPTQPAQTFAFIDILVLADLYNTMSEYDRAIRTIRNGCRWLQGRASQRFWDGCGDDREYDLPREDRGGSVSIERSGDIQPGHYPLDVNARHRLAIARIKLGEVEEGKMHASIVLAQDVLDYAALFGEIADSYFEREMYADARPIYEVLGAHPATSSLYVLLQVAVCRKMLGDLEGAAEVYEQVVDADQTNNDAKMKLAELYEIMDEPRKALGLVYQVIDCRKRRTHQPEAASATDDGTQPPGTSLFEEKSRTKAKSSAPAKSRLSLAELKALEEEREREVVLGHKRVEELWLRMLHEDVEAEREWMIEAEKLVEMFRETRNLFVTTRDHEFKGMFPKRKIQRRDDVDEDRMASRLELNERDKHRRTKDDNQAHGKIDSFRGVKFVNWLRIFMQYSFILTKRGDYDQAEEVLRHILLSNAYRDSNSQNTIRTAIITCAIFAGRFSIAVEQCRKFINTHQFNNEAFRLLLVSIASGHRPTDAFVSSTLQKHALRELRLHDTAVKNPELLKWNVAGRRYGLLSSGKEESSKANEGEEEVDEEVEMPGSAENTTTDKTAVQMPTKNNPVIVTIYGQICLAAKSYQSAIFYLLHAYDYCPEDPIVCLSLAIASLGRAMQRQSDNRHHMIAQGMAFLSQYRKIRKSYGDETMLAEVDYNFGRAFHQLGLHSHAVFHYERVLEIAEKEGDDCMSVAKEAAYNLSLIYVTTGAVPLADAIYRRWLSI